MHESHLVTTLIKFGGTVKYAIHYNYYTLMPSIMLVMTLSFSFIANFSGESRFVGKLQFNV